MLMVCSIYLFLIIFFKDYRKRWFDTKLVFFFFFFFGEGTKLVLY